MFAQNEKISGGVLIIVILIAVCCCCRRKKDEFDNSSKSDYKKGHPTQVNMANNRNDATMASNASYDFRRPNSNNDPKNNGEI